MMKELDKRREKFTTFDQIENIVDNQDNTITQKNKTFELWWNSERRHYHLEGSKNENKINENEYLKV